MLQVTENPYKSPLAAAKPPIENARRALAFWLVFMGGWMAAFLALIVYSCAVSFDLPLAIDGVFPLLFAIGSFWFALRVRTRPRNQGYAILAARHDSVRRGRVSDANLCTCKRHCRIAAGIA